MSQEQPPPTQPVGPPPAGQPGEWGGGVPASYGPYPPPQPGWQHAPDQGYTGPYAGPPPPRPQSGYAAAPQAPSAPRDPSSTWRAILQIACPVLMVIALAVAENGRRGYTDWTLWALFATVAALVQLAPLVVKGDPQRSWTTGAIGVVALIGYWVVIVLPGIDTNTGFLQTFAVAAAAVGCWLTPGRRI